MGFEVFTGKDRRTSRRGPIRLTIMAGERPRFMLTRAAREAAVPPLDREVVLMFDPDAKAIGIRAATDTDWPSVTYRMGGTSRQISASAFLDNYGITGTGRILGHVNDDGVLVFPLDGLQ